MEETCMAFIEFQFPCYSMVMALSVEADTSLKLRLRTSWRMLVIQREDYEITFFTSISCLGLQPNHWHSNNVHSTDTTDWERWAVAIKTNKCMWTTTCDEECYICPYISQTQTAISAWWQCNTKKFPLSYTLSCLSRPQGPLVWRPIDTNPGLNFNPGLFFFCLNAHLLRFSLFFLAHPIIKFSSFQISEIKFHINLELT